MFARRGSDCVGRRFPFCLAQTLGLATLSRHLQDHLLGARADRLLEKTVPDRHQLAHRLDQDRLLVDPDNTASCATRRMVEQGI